MVSLPSIGPQPVVDRATRAFWRHAGRRVDLDGAEHWLRAPVAAGSVVADDWLAAAASVDGAEIREGVPGAGLLPELAHLDGPGFRTGDLHPDVRHFYEHTSLWDMDVRIRWSAAFRPAGELVARHFGRRVRQLAIPTTRSDGALRMDSRVVVIARPDGTQRAAGWIRTLAATGDPVYSGCYSVRRLPGADRPSIHVAFPLEAGNVQVFLRPMTDGRGGLVLSSPGGRFGADGAYVLVAERGTFAARVPLRERFHVYVDGDGVLRTDHILALWSAPAVRLHYRLSRAS
jgi:hypothetical protein